MKSRANQPRLSVVRLALAVLPLSAGAFLSAQLLSACQPGTVDCESGACGGASGGGGSTNKGGSGGGGSSGGGSGGGGSGGSSGAMVTPDTAVPDCGMFGSKVGDVEMNFFPMKCGTGKGSTCHGSGAVWGDFSKPPLHSGTTGNKAMLKSSIVCTGEKLVNTSNSAKSVIVLKVSNDGPKCPDGTTENGVRMPADEADTTKSKPLSADELKCLTSYVKVVAGGN
jgi:hypothetical protein